MELSAEKREQKTVILRKAGIIPAVLYSKKSSKGLCPVLNLQVIGKDFVKAYAEFGKSAIFTLIVENDKKNVLIKELQQDPVTLSPIHIEFYEVDMTQTIDTEIPIEIINEENCEPVSSKRGIAIKVLDMIEVRCLPKYIPQAFEIDVSSLKEVGDVLTVKEAISVDSSKIEILTDQDEPVVKIDYAEQLETEEDAKAVEEVEVISEKEKEERAKANEEAEKDDSKK